MDSENASDEAVRGRLIQEDLTEPHREWKMLVACILLNRTRGSVARPIVERLLEAYPSPEALHSENPAHVALMLQPLGLHWTRASNLHSMSRDYGTIPVENLPGVGPYAMESRRIFILNDLNFEPKDAKLRAYVDRKKQEKFKIILKRYLLFLSEGLL